MVMIEKDEPELIPADEVPAQSSRSGRSPSKWTKIFREIPDGMARVFTKEEVSYPNLRQSLKRQHDKGRFKHLEFAMRGDTMYIINRNPSEKHPPKTR